ncbi:MAG: alpha/beta hydrolase [Clostridia bacterium]|nr:alpha/beta hydrolase [Clostridia bacterium]
MRAFTVDLKEEYSFLKGGKLSCMLMDMPWDQPKAWKRPALIVVPGGAYWMVSKREGEPVASAFFAKGFQTFILDYLTAPKGIAYPEQLLELASAVDYVKKNADAFCVNKDEVFVVGFSAGGHLTGNLCVEHTHVCDKAGVALDCKPTAVGLCYPVISQIHGHQGSYNNLLQGYTNEAKEELLKTLNLNEAVSVDTPPAFLWATATDPSVPADNAIRYALALAEKGIAYELHVYPQGYHGLSTGADEVNEEPYRNQRVCAWVGDCIQFFKLYIQEAL